MRSRGLLLLGAVLAVILLAGAGTSYVLSRKVKGSAEQVGRDYLAAWGRGDLDAMEELAADPPGDFTGQHRSLSQGLSVSSIDFEPGPVVADGDDAAHQDFKVSRGLAGHGTWSYRSTLRLGVVDRKWRVLWTPATLYRALTGHADWKLRKIDAPAATLVARDGKALPREGMLQPYVNALTDRFGENEDGKPGWEIEMTARGQPPKRVALLARPRGGKKIRTTLDLKVQAAAEKAVDGAGKSAAIVAIRPSTGEILALADTLGGTGAFLNRYAPGSTFKVITAAGLLSDGMSAGSGTQCPATVVVEQRTIRNHEGGAFGSTSLNNAFAQSCNTTFSQLGVERLGADKLAAAARNFGFNGPITPGLPAERGDFPEPGNGAELAEASFGQGRVQASPLMMALVAAAVADGTWRSPRLVDADLIREVEKNRQSSHPVPNAGALRTMMRAVVTSGTAAGAGLPSGMAGKTGTAEVGGGQPDHAWFIGFQGDLAFAVLVPGGGSGPKVAAPLAARFLRAR